jgi:hypothetical protein
MVIPLAPDVIELSPRHVNRGRRRLLGALALVACPALGAVPLRVVHQGPETSGDIRNAYHWDLLRAALETTRAQWGGFDIISGDNMNGLRAVGELQRGKLNLIRRSTSIELERSLRPIRIPLDKGLLGYRVFLIRRQLQARLDEVRTLDDLRRFSIGQHSAWTDVEVLERAGFTVVRGGKYDGLFGMLDSGRFDLFSRGVSEVGAEMREYGKRFPDMVVERNLLLNYPLAAYFFVRADAAGEQIAQRVEAGLASMLKDGTFDRMFDAFKAPLEQAFNLSGRRLLHISNPLLSPETPLKQANLWFVPGK